jgi:hypothetical protein
MSKIFVVNTIDADIYRWFEHKHCILTFFFFTNFGLLWPLLLYVPLLLCVGTINPGNTLAREEITTDYSVVTWRMLSLCTHMPTRSAWGTCVRTARTEEVCSLLIGIAYLAIDGIKCHISLLEEITVFHLKYSPCYLKAIWKYCGVFCATAHHRPSLFLAARRLKFRILSFRFWRRML